MSVTVEKGLWTAFKSWVASMLDDKKIQYLVLPRVAAYMNKMGLFGVAPQRPGMLSCKEDDLEDTEQTIIRTWQALQYHSSQAAKARYLVVSGIFSGLGLDAYIECIK